MAGKERPQNPDETQGTLLGALNALKGQAGGLDVAQLDGKMLWYATTLLVMRGASIQLGLTKDCQSWAVQIWEGKFPVKDYFATTAALNKHLAALVRLCGGKNLPGDVEATVREYGW